MELELRSVERQGAHEVGVVVVLDLTVEWGVGM